MHITIDKNQIFSLAKLCEFQIINILYQVIPTFVSCSHVFTPFNLFNPKLFKR